MNPSSAHRSGWELRSQRVEANELALWPMVKPSSAQKESNGVGASTESEKRTEKKKKKTVTHTNQGVNK